MTKARFTAEKRGRFLQLLDEGKTIGQACVAAGVTRSTVNRWDRLGIEGKSPEMIEFSRRYGEGRERRTNASNRSRGRFTAEKRTAFLLLIAAGRTLAQACDEAGVSSVTVQTWDARGRADHNATTVEFARFYAMAIASRPAPEPSPQLEIAGSDAAPASAAPAASSAPALAGPVTTRFTPPPLTQDELIRNLEKASRRGSVGATKLLLERPWERRDDGDEDDQPKPEDLDFDNLEEPVNLERERQRRSSS